MKLPLPSRNLRRWLTVALIAAAGAAAIAHQKLVVGVDNLYYDLWHHVAGKRRTPEHVSIVSVDDQTFIKLKDDPLAFWQPHFARAMKVIEDAGAKVIGLDFVYATSAENWLERLKLDSTVSRTYDASFRERLPGGGKVLVGHLVEMSNGQSELLLPPKEHHLLLDRQLDDVALANLFPDTDNIVRAFLPVLLEQQGLPALGFSTRLALMARDYNPRDKEWAIGGETLTRSIGFRQIGYVGPSGTVPRVSMAQLLEPNALSLPAVQALKGRIVIITAHDSSSLQDTHFTPYSRSVWGYTESRGQMAGGEVHANIVETLLSGRYPRELPLMVNLALIAVISALAGAVFLRLHPLTSAVVGIVVALAAVMLGYLGFKADTILPIAAMQTALLLAFLLTLGLRLTGEERARRRLRSMFGSYVSDEVVDLLVSRQGEGERLDLAGEELTVTVLFSDIRNFTTISEKLSAHEVVEMLNTYFARVCEPILAERGNVNKYIGDAVMAMFGSPVPYPDHARRALKAALGMLREADEFKKWMVARFPDRDLPPFDIGIGVHTGVVISGDIGTDKRREYTIIGDTVNTASRLEGMTKSLGWRLVASRQTVDAAGAGVREGEGNSIAVKGRAGEVAVVQVLAVDDFSPP
jgi:adenylate cyclase